MRRSAVPFARNERNILWLSALLAAFFKYCADAYKDYFDRLLILPIKRAGTE